MSVITLASLESAPREKEPSKVKRFHFNAQIMIEEENPRPCGFCGHTDGYYIEYGGWTRCVVCHGC